MSYNKKYLKIKILSENVVGKGVEKCKDDDAKVRGAISFFYNIRS